MYFLKKNEVKISSMLSSTKMALISFACLLWFIPGYAARQISPAQWQQITQDKAMSYKNDIEAIPHPVEYKPGMMQKMIQSLFAFFGSGIGNILLWAIVAFVIVYVVWQLFFSGDSFLFSRSKKVMQDATTEQTEEEDLANTNWDALLQQAIANNDVRLAVRYSYKRLLQLLQQQELIQYRNDKTNYEYAVELTDTAYKQSFKQLSRQYEYAWYGHFTLSAGAYNDHMALFNSVQKQLGA